MNSQPCPAPAQAPEPEDLDRLPSAPEAERDLDDIDLALQFDPLTCAWQSLGETGEVRISEEEEEILLALKDLGKAKVSSIAREIHKDRGNTSRRCTSLWVRGKISKEDIEGATYYYVPTQGTQGTQGTEGTLPV
jgi:hypothetical protein